MSEGAAGGVEGQAGTHAPVDTQGDPNEGFNALRGSLPEDLKGNPHVSRFGSFEEMAREHANLVPKIGEKGVILPKEENLHDVSRFLKEMGRPEEAAGYDRGDFQPPEGLPWSEENESSLTELMHSAGVTQAQYDKLLRGYTAMQKEEYDRIQGEAVAHHNQQLEALKKEYGPTFDAQMAVGSRIMGEVFGEQAQDLLQARLVDGTLVGNHPGFVKGILKLRNFFSEDQLTVDGGGGMPHVDSPNDARGKIKAKEADKEFMNAYFDKHHEGHAAAQAEMDGLYAAAYPDGQ